MNRKAWKLLLILNVLCLPSMAQRIISNKLEINFTYSINTMIRDETVTRDTYQSPSLFRNFQNTSSVKVSVNYQLHRMLHAGVEVSSDQFGEWDHPSGRFNDASYSIVAFRPQAKFHTTFQEYGFFNRVTLFMEGGPRISRHTLTLERDVYSSPQNELNLKEDEFYAFGIGASAGIQTAVTNSITLGLSLGLTYDWVSSILFDDETLLYQSASLSLGFRFMKNKRYKYSL